jgi:hypothetical protein
MFSSFDERAKHWIAGTFCMLLVIGGVAPAPARASCGHDVTSNGSRSARESLFDLKLSKDLGADQANSAPAGPHRELPCSGPSCSRDRGFPPAPATSVMVKMIDPWCSTTISSHWDDPVSAEKPVDLSISHPRHNTSRLERPPRNSQRCKLS